MLSIDRSRGSAPLASAPRGLLSGVWLVLTNLLISGCSSPDEGGPSDGGGSGGLMTTGGAQGTGGGASGGSPASGGASAGGAPSSGGMASGGTASGGVGANDAIGGGETGGVPSSGGMASGGVATGGMASGGTGANSTGGRTSGGDGSGGLSRGSGGSGGALPSGGAMPEGGAGTGGESACDSSITEQNKATVDEAIRRLFVETDASAFEEFWADPYLQHNPVAASGVDAFWSFFGSLVAQGNQIYWPERTIGECDLVLIHGNYGSTGPMLDMFRLDDGKLVEHWDAGPNGNGPNASGHTALDGPTEPTTPELSGHHKALVLAFTDELIAGNTEEAGAYLSEALIEHNPQGRDGREAFLEYRASNDITIERVHHVIADGDFVFTMTEGDLGNQRYGFYDLYRLSDDRIVEHWDGRRQAVENTASGLPIF